jgi:glycosyltransferase involved in cell wall biosynthesis
MSQFRRNGVFSVLTLHETQALNALSAFRNEQDPLEKLRLFYRWMSIMRYEVVQSRKFDRVVTMTEFDAAYLRSYSSHANIRAIPIGVDTDEFHPSPEAPDMPPKVLFLGNFRHSPNILAAEFLNERLAPLFPDVRFVLSGPNMPGSICPRSNVEFSGYAPDTRVLYPRPNTIVAAPLFSGTGQRVKLLEAFAMGCPVVTTSIGGLGFPITDGVEAFIADTPERFAESLRRLLSSVVLRRQLGASGREMVVRHFSWQAIGQRFLDVVEEAIDR